MDPIGHGVGAGGAVVGVDDDDGDDDGGDDEDHGEEHVLPDERHGAGGGGDELHDDEQEHREGQQDGDAQGHLLTCNDHIVNCTFHESPPDTLVLKLCFIFKCHRRDIFEPRTPFRAIKHFREEKDQLYFLHHYSG